jgi:hypothetical protein
MEMQTVKDKDAFVQFGLFIVQHVLHTGDAFSYKYKYNFIST